MLQPSEAHIPYVLQFLIDFNLQGMNYIHLKSAVCRRKPGGNLSSLSIHDLPLETVVKVMKTLLILMWSHQAPASSKSIVARRIF